MSIDSKIIDSIKPIVPEVNPNKYDGNALAYVVYTYSEFPEVFAESTSDIKRYSVNLSFYLPHGENPRARKKAIARALKNAGFTMPQITNASDDDGQHYVFEFEGIDGDI